MITDYPQFAAPPEGAHDIRYEIQLAVDFKPKQECELYLFLPRGRHRKTPFYLRASCTGDSRSEEHSGTEIAPTTPNS